MKTDPVKLFKGGEGGLERVTEEVNLIKRHYGNIMKSLCIIKIC
jgi:hypothetical protein